MANETINELRLDIRTLTKELKQLSPVEQVLLGDLLQQLGQKRAQLQHLERGIADILGGKPS